MLRTTGGAKLSQTLDYIGGLQSVGLGEARKITHFEDIACGMLLLAHSPHLGERGCEFVLPEPFIYCVSHLVMISDTICDPYVQSHRIIFFVRE